MTAVDALSPVAHLAQIPPGPGTVTRDSPRGTVARGFRAEGADEGGSTLVLTGGSSRGHRPRTRARRGGQAWGQSNWDTAPLQAQAGQAAGGLLLIKGSGISRGAGNAVDLSTKDVPVEV